MNESSRSEERTEAPPVIAPPVQPTDQPHFHSSFQPPEIDVELETRPRLEPIITTPPSTDGKRVRFASNSQRRTVGLLSTTMVVLAMVMIGPALSHWNLPFSPGWASLILLVALLQIAYAAWLVLSPHWSSLWVAMIVMTSVAALYATGMAINMIAAEDSSMILDLADLRRVQGSFPTIWCGSLVFACLLMAYIFGLLSFRWRRQARS